MRPERRECGAGKVLEEVAERRETAGFPGWLAGTGEMERKDSRERREPWGRKVRLAATACPGSREPEASRVSRAMLAGRERRETPGCRGVTE